MLAEDGPAIWVDLAEPNGVHAGAFESETKAANAAEEIEDIQCRALRLVARANFQ